MTSAGNTLQHQDSCAQDPTLLPQLIQFASFQPKTNQVALTAVETICSSSIPKDASGASSMTSAGNTFQRYSVQGPTHMPQFIQVAPFQPTISRTLIKSRALVKVAKSKSKSQPQSTSSGTVKEPAEKVFNSQLPATLLQSTLGVTGDKAQLSSKLRQTTPGIKANESFLPTVRPQPEELIKIKPPSIVIEPPTPPQDDTSPMKKLFQKAPFSVGFAGFIFIFTIAFFDSDSSVYQLIIDKFFKYLFGCLPMYWILRVDDCYRFSLRRTKTWLGDHFQIFFE